MRRIYNLGRWRQILLPYSQIILRRKVRVAPTLFDLMALEAKIIAVFAKIVAVFVDCNAVFANVVAAEADIIAVFANRRAGKPYCKR
ncbi:MAG: hypothetical protein LBL74_06420 [Bacteroidales bacterium]|nr:hypothetical protein [Bacteroidales bacterium]